MSDLKQNPTEHGYWYQQREKQAVNIIKRWERKYPTKTVRLFVEDALDATRSPGKRSVYRAWLNEHPKPEALVPRIWADTIMEQLKSSVNNLRAFYKDLPPLEWETEYLSNGSVTEYGGLVGDKMNVPATSLNDSPGQREQLEALGCPVPHPEPYNDEGPWINPETGGLTFWKPEGE